MKKNLKFVLQIWILLLIAFALFSGVMILVQYHKGSS